MDALADGFTFNTNLEKLDLRENRITDLGALPILDKIPRSIKALDLSYNSLGYNAVSKLTYIISSRQYK